MDMVTILASFTFVSFLWWSDSGNETWRRIMTNSWTTRSVTLAALAIRSAITAQALVGTAMLAALTFQWQQVTLLNAPAISMLRFANSGPSSLSLHSLKKSSIHQPLVGLLAIFLTLIITAVNISSTALLYDLHLKVLPGHPESVESFFGINPESERNYTVPKPSEDFWRFILN